MIEWKKFDREAFSKHMEENDYLILQKSGRITHATLDAANLYFIYTSEEYEIIIPFRYVTHYAEINFPGDQNE